MNRRMTRVKNLQRARRKVLKGKDERTFSSSGADDYPRRTTRSNNTERSTKDT